MRYSLLVTFALVAACAGDAPTAPGEAPFMAKGGKPGDGSAGGIVPVTLVNNRSLGCGNSHAYAVSSGATTFATGACMQSGLPVPFVWRAGSGAQTLALTPGGFGGTAVSDDGTIFGTTADLKPFVRALNTSAAFLPLPAGAIWGDVTDVTHDGSVATGSASNESDSFFVLWRAAGSAWTVEPFPGYPAAIDADGDVIGGRLALQATVWQRPAGEWIPRELPDDGASKSRVTGINAAGTAIVGTRTLPATSDPSVEYEQPVAWLPDGMGGWSMQLLPGFTFSEGVANSVETLTDGRLVAVGWVWEDQPGGTEQRWAVAWLRSSGGTFGAPVKLAPLSKGAPGDAEDVNARGEIVGAGWTRSGTSAVMWRLP